MLIQEDGDEFERADLYVTAQSDPYHSCSGDSYWVRQYLECCDCERVGNNEIVRPSALVARGAFCGKVTLRVG